MPSVLVANERNIRRLVCFMAVLGLLLGVAPLAQASGGPQLNVVDVNTVNYPTVKVTVEALGADGTPIAGLGQSSFAAFENGSQQPIVSADALQVSSTPLTVMLALDTSQSMADGGKLQSVKQAATTFVSQMRSIDRVGLIQFDSQLSLVAPFTSDRGSLTNKIDGLTAQGNTRIYDALYLALKETSSVDGSKAVVLLTDGKDTESAIDLAHTLALIQQAKIRVYTIGIGSDVDAAILTRIAAESGGRYYAAPSASDIGYAFRLMSSQLRSRYEIEYTSPATAAIGSTVALQITAQTSQGLASARTSYITPVYARPVSTVKPAGTQPATTGAQVTATDLRSAYLVGALAALGVLIAAAGLAYAQAQRAHHSRLAFFIGGADEQADEIGRSLFGVIVADMSRIFSGVITRLLPRKQIQKISQQLTMAGNPFGWRASQFVVIKFLSAGAFGLLSMLVVAKSNNVLRGLAFVVIASYFGYRVPTFWLKRRIKSRQNAILRALPDALDLMTICVEAGLGLDSAMLEVVNRWDNPLSHEFSTVLSELQMGRSRRDALRGLSKRIGLQEVTSFSSALVQADEMGMGIARPLALQAEQLRIKRKQRAEKLAHEAAIKMVVAMGLFIMPALFMIILSPAVVQIHQAFSSH